jgi:hypothetical protein
VSDWSEKERAFLDSVKKDWGPAPGVAASVRAGVAKRVEAPAPPAKILSAKAIAALAGAGLLAAAGLVWLGTRGDAPSPKGPQTTTIAPRAAEPIPPPPSVTATLSISVDSLPNAPPQPRATIAPAPASASASAPPTDTLSEELALLRTAQTALRSGAPNDALTALHTHATRFPRGVLREERMTLEVLALCDAGRVEDARHARAALIATSPSSSHLEPLAISCAAR